MHGLLKWAAVGLLLEEVKIVGLDEGGLVKELRGEHGGGASGPDLGVLGPAFKKVPGHLISLDNVTPRPEDRKGKTGLRVHKDGEVNIGRDAVLDGETRLDHEEEQLVQALLGGDLHRPKQPPYLVPDQRHQLLLRQFGPGGEVHIGKDPLHQLRGRLKGSPDLVVLGRPPWKGWRWRW